MKTVLSAILFRKYPKEKNYFGISCEFEYGNDRYLSKYRFIFNGISISQPLSIATGLVVYCLKKCLYPETFCEYDDIIKLLKEDILPRNNYLSWVFYKVFDNKNILNFALKHHIGLSRWGDY